jgi:hypothetical protein
MLVLLENKGYLSRTQGLSRGLTVTTRPALESSELAEQDYMALRALAGWQSVARDAELRMAAHTQDSAAKADLIETARARHQQVCHLESIVELRGDMEFAGDPMSLVEHELLGALPRCDRWELFVVDELVCNRVAWRVSEYASKTRPVVRGLLWRNERLSEQALARSQRWIYDVLDSIPGEREYKLLSSSARELAQNLYDAAQTMDSWCNSDRALISSALDPSETGALA